MSPKIINRFMAKVDKTDSCWFWIGARTCRDPKVDAYGVFRETSSRYRLAKAHRVSWRIYRGPIPPGQFVWHSCEHRLCVNPAHLYLSDRRNIGQEAHYPKRLPKRKVKRVEKGRIGEPEGKTEGGPNVETV